jgi:hypothetical protein
MSSNYIPPKEFNYLAQSITASTTLDANAANLIYFRGTGAATLTLPALSLVTDGSPIFVINEGSATLTVNDSTNTLVASVPQGYQMTIIADKINSNPAAWKIQNGPASVSGGVSGPASSTSTAIALWNGTTGQTLENSVVLVDGSGNMTGVDSVTLATTGGTATPLNYYEEYQLSGNTFTGAFTTAQASVLRLTRIGRLVNCLVPAVYGTAAAAVATASVTIPSRFLPNAGSVGTFGTLNGEIIVQNGATTATNGQTTGQWTINPTNGAFIIGVTSATGPAAFGATNNNGIPAFAISWSI